MTTQIKTYTIGEAEKNAVQEMVEAYAPVSMGVRNGRELVQVRALYFGWEGAEWVRYVADYQDGPSVGYAGIADFMTDNGFPGEGRHHASLLDLIDDETPDTLHLEWVRLSDSEPAEQG